MLLQHGFEFWMTCSSSWQDRCLKSAVEDKARGVCSRDLEVLKEW